MQKRHQARLLPAPGALHDGRGNVLPGTVVDTGICHPHRNDFFLNAHAGLQGTNRPAHYSVLADQLGLGADGVQQLTFWLSHLFCRCTRSISVCPPAQYAHLAAARAAVS